MRDRWRERRLGRAKSLDALVSKQRLEPADRAPDPEEGPTGRAALGHAGAAELLAYGTGVVLEDE